MPKSSGRNKLLNDTSFIKCPCGFEMTKRGMGIEQERCYDRVIRQHKKVCEIASRTSFVKVRDPMVAETRSIRGWDMARYVSNDDMRMNANTQMVLDQIAHLGLESNGVDIEVRGNVLYTNGEVEEAIQDAIRMPTGRELYDEIMGVPPPRPTKRNHKNKDKTKNNKKKKKKN